VEYGSNESIFGNGRFPNSIVPTEECDTYPRQKKMKRYNPKYLMEKEVNIYVLYCSSKQEYISTIIRDSYCIFNHQNYQIIIGQ
jgi:hypothetical protein